jgi:Plavaka transposase
MSNAICPCCKRSFKISTGMQIHWNHSDRCREFVFKTLVATAPKQKDDLDDNEVNEAATSEIIFNSIDNDNNFDMLCNDGGIEKDTLSHDDEKPSCLLQKRDMDILQQYTEFKALKKDIIPLPLPTYKSCVDLLHILKTSNTPLYLYDTIMEWASKARWVHRFDFIKTQIPPRESLIDTLKNQFDYKALEPRLIEMDLPGSQTKVNLVVHDFKQCFYSLLNDPELMNTSNLLIDPENLFNNPLSRNKQKYLSDINTGDVWRMAHNTYVSSENSELLCPIIFFIDKTHTDKNGRLCIEQIRFTLGIFKLHVRNQNRAWRTLGYILDQSQISTNSSDEKMKDYQEMTSQILQSFREVQSKAIGWKLNVGETSIPVFFRTPVLFIIGDTDGHDKLVGKYANRTNKVKRLCRYCDCPFDQTDDPYYKFTLNKRRDIFKLIAENKVKDLNDMSFHCIKNAWSDISFCDNKLGIYGAAPAEIMHCLQKGLYEYLVTALFSQKQIKKQKGEKRKGKQVRQKNIKKNRSIKPLASGNLKEDDTDTIIDEEIHDHIDDIKTSCRNVFSALYAKKFDGLTRRYGKYLMHQSNRDLPRTHFYTNYTSTGYKNASELTGMLIVFLMVFSTKEGETKLDKNLGEKRSSQYIHLFELMLMLESFCKAEFHERKSVVDFKKIVPMILEYYKDTLDRQEGNQMKIIKYHLVTHFADDILRFGSMANFDSSIGESHHKVMAKKPAGNTQRRKDIFEVQTAKRQVDNLTIDRAYDFVYPGHRHCTETSRMPSKSQNKNKVIEFCGRVKNLVYTNDSKPHRPICQWKDNIFHEQLVTECLKAIKSGSLKPPIRFFTQHNRSGNIFRADPQYHKNSKEPWYDWVMVNWGSANEDYVPAKLLLFIEVNEEDFTGAFKFGGSYIEAPGSYAIAYSFETNVDEPAHLDSRLVTYGKLVTENNTPMLYAFDVNCIADTCIAVPYNPEDNLMNAKEWLLLQAKDKWYETFLDFMKEKLNE